jgi:hypothetical protein
VADSLRRPSLGSENQRQYEGSISLISEVQLFSSLHELQACLLRNFIMVSTTFSSVVFLLLLNHAFLASAAQLNGNGGCYALARRYPSQVSFPDSTVYTNETSSKIDF